MSNFDMDRICRLCCSVKTRMRPLFQHRPKYPFSLCQMIYATAQVDVAPNDGMPQKICKPCVTNVIKMFTTIDSYRENDLKLRQQLERTMPEEIEDAAGALAICIQNGVAEMNCSVSQQLELEPMNCNDDQKDVSRAEDDDEGRSMQIGICIKNDPGVAETHDAQDDSTNADNNNETNTTELNVHIKEEIHENQDGIRDEVHDEGGPVLQNIRIKSEHGTDEKQDADTSAEYADKRRSTRLNIHMKNQPVNTPNEHELIFTTNNFLDAFTSSPYAVQAEPILKRPRGRPSNKNKESRPKLNDYKCYICKSDSHGTPTALLTHLNSTHSDLLPFTCPECVMETVVLKNLLTLNVHMRRHLHPVKCLYCDKRYISKYKVDIHVKHQHPSKFDNSPTQGSMKCDRCGKKFPSSVSLTRHIKREHASSSTVSCADCGEKFSGKAKLRTHIKREHIGSGKKFECNLCQKRLTSLKILQGHIKKYHTSTSTVFTCSHCPQTFCTKVLMRSHVKLEHSSDTRKRKRS